MAKLSLYLLGPPRVELEDTSIEIKRRKALALLIYLAVSGERQSRETLAALLWPENSHRRARKALRRDLSELNLALDGVWLDADRTSVSLQPGMWLDVTEFQRCVAAETIDPQTLTAATNLYRDDFLTGFTLPDCPAFDEWQFFQTESLRQALASTLERLTGILSDQTDYETAIPHARRWLALDPLHEPAHRQLMQLYAQAGQQAAALRQYQLCRETLKAELGVSPAEETTVLYQHIRTGKLKTPAAISPAPLLPRSPTPQRHNLPIQTTSFIGREDELAQIKRLLLDEPDCRLLNLVGPGGIGKTRLALAAATQTLEVFLDGTFFVSLAPIGEVADMVPAIAEALRFTFYGSADPKDQLLDYLSQKQLLLVVDNFEHLLEGVDLLSNILSQAPDVTLLATSRERLSLQEEWVYEVQGLSFPAVGGQTSKVSKTFEVLTSYSAVELFTQRARQITADFIPSAQEMADIGRICQLVEGMPLGLELAAPWIKILSCREIAAEIERSLDFLTTLLQNVAEHHRSLRVVFEQTWGRLSEVEQSVLSQLSVFRGSCTRKAAEAVAGATLPVLSSLVDKALLRRTNLGRYELHELVRQFAEMQLQNDPAAVEVAQQRHRDHFVAFLEACTAGVKGGRQKETVAEIKADMDNVRLVWRRAVRHRNAEAFERAAECLFVFYLYSSGHYEGQTAFQQAAAAFIVGSGTVADDGSPDELVVLDRQENLAGFLLAGQGYFLGRTRDPFTGQMLVEQALALLRRSETNDRYKEGFVLLWLGWMVLLQGRVAKALEYVEPTLAVLTETGDRWAEGWSLLLWANAVSHVRPLEAEDVYQRGLAVCRESGDLNNLGYTSQMRSGVNMKLGRYAQAKQYINEAIRVFEEVGNVLGLGYALQRQGQLAIAQGEYQQAIQSLRQSIANSRRLGPSTMSPGPELCSVKPFVCKVITTRLNNCAVSRWKWP